MRFWGAGIASMTSHFWFYAIGAPILVSFGYLISAVISYVTRGRSCDPKDVLALRVREFLGNLDVGACKIDERDLIPLRESIDLLEQCGLLPTSSTNAAHDRRRG